MDGKLFPGFILVLLILAAGAAYVYAHPSVLGFPLSIPEKQESTSLFTNSTSSMLTSTREEK
jgi:hypothetical protein